MLEKIEEKLDKIVAEQHRMKNKLNVVGLTLENIEDNLEEHMRRTEASEKRLAILESYRYYILGALFMAALLSSSFRDVLLKLIDVAK